jgi:hypothetical protein
MWAVIVLVGILRDIFPVCAMLLAPLVTLIGGGDSVFASTIAATIADLSPGQRMRTTLFAYTGSLAYVTTLAAPAVAAYTMSLNVWLPFWIGLSLLIIIAIPITSMLPGKPSTPQTSGFGLFFGDEQGPLLEQYQTPEHFPSRLQPQSWNSVYRRARSHVKEMTDSILDRPRFQLLLGIFFLASFASSNSALLIQYISKRFHWTFAQAGYLLSAKAVVNVLLLTVIVPTSVRLAISKLGLTAQQININAAQISIAISIMGAICIGISLNIAFLVAGKFKLLDCNED